MGQEPDSSQIGIHSGNAMVMGAMFGVVLGPLLQLGPFSLVLGALIGLVLGGAISLHGSKR
jgi:hypothetical protein